MDYGNGDFDFIRNSGDKELLQNAHWAITETGLWDWMSKFEPKQDEGFAFSKEVELRIINKKMSENKDIYESHSGCSYGCTMRSMEYIAKNGYESFREAYLTKNK